MNQISLDFLTKTLQSLRSPFLENICLSVLTDERFVHGTASVSKHHAFDGGLLVHTAEVLETALQMAKSSYLVVNTDVLITAVIFHDYGKIYDYEKITNGNGEAYAYTSHQKLIRHVARSYAMFMNAVSHKLHKLDEKIVENIGHCILAHHGRKEWGSPIEPQTVEAYILHVADDLSAKYPILK